jgi:hypothetical protein
LQFRTGRYHERCHRQHLTINERVANNVL